MELHLEDFGITVVTDLLTSSYGSQSSRTFLSADEALLECPFEVKRWICYKVYHMAVNESICIYHEKTSTIELSIYINRIGWDQYELTMSRTKTHFINLSEE